MKPKTKGDESVDCCLLQQMPMLRHASYNITDNMAVNKFNPERVGVRCDKCREPGVTNDKRQMTKDK